MMHLEFLPVNQAWVWMFGDSIIRIGTAPMFFEHKSDAEHEAKILGIT